MKVSVVIVTALLLLGAVAAFRTLEPKLPAAERGRRLAERTGCFACHGPEGIRGVSNPGRADKTVPNYEGDLMMFAESPEEIRAWIERGVTPKRARSNSWKAERRRGTLRMPAFGRRLSARQIDDLVAYVMAVNGKPEPEDTLAARGRERIEGLGCVGCHGAGGRLARPNPGSLKGYVPSWDGADFPELVSGEREFHEWVQDGVSARFKTNRLARFFLGRAVLKMPAYRQRLEPGDLDTLWAYVRWLRRGE